MEYAIPAHIYRIFPLIRWPWSAKRYEVKCGHDFHKFEVRTSQEDIEAVCPRCGAVNVFRASWIH